MVSRLPVRLDRSSIATPKAELTEYKKHAIQITLAPAVDHRRWARYKARIKIGPNAFQASLITLTQPKTHAFSDVCPSEEPNRKLSRIEMPSIAAVATPPTIRNSQRMVA